MLRVVVCVSGGGTNLQAIIDGIANGSVFHTEIVRVVCNNPGVRALERAKAAGIESVCVSPKVSRTGKRLRRLFAARWKKPARI